MKAIYRFGGTAQSFPGAIGRGPAPARVRRLVIDGLPRRVAVASGARRRQEQNVFKYGLENAVGGCSMV
jgi:hypothetical protein